MWGRILCVLLGHHWVARAGRVDKVCTRCGMFLWPARTPWVRVA